MCRRLLKQTAFGPTHEPKLMAYPHKVAYGFGRIQGPKFRRLGSVDISIVPECQTFIQHPKNA